MALAPYASRVPFETWLLPRAHGARFEEASDATPRRRWRGALREVLAGINWALERPAYNLVLHTGPFDGAADGSFHWHLEIVPAGHPDRRFGVGERHRAPGSPVWRRRRPQRCCERG